MFYLIKTKEIITKYQADWLSKSGEGVEIALKKKKGVIK